MLDLSKFFFGEQMPVVTPPVQDGVMADYDAMMNYTDQMMASGAGAPVGFLGSLAQMGGQRSFLQPEAPAVSAASGFAMGPQMYQQEMARQQERNIQAAQLRAEEDKQRQHHQFLTEVEKGRQRMETQKMLVDMKDRKDQFALKRDEFKLKQEEHQLAQEMKQFELDQIIANKDAPKMQVMSDGRVALMFNDGTVQYAGAEEALAFAKDLEGIKQDSYLKQLQAKSFYGGTGGGVGGGTGPAPEGSGEYGVGADGLTAIQGFTTSRNKMINDLLMKATGAGAVPDMEEIMAIVDQIYPLAALQTMPRAEHELEYGKGYLRTDAGFVPLMDGMTFGPDTEVVEYMGPGNLKTVPFGEAPAEGEVPAEGEAAPAGTEAAPTKKPLTIRGEGVVRDSAGRLGTIDSRGRFKEKEREPRYINVEKDGPRVGGVGMFASTTVPIDIDAPGTIYDKETGTIRQGGKVYTPAQQLLHPAETFTDEAGNKRHRVGSRVYTPEELDARNREIEESITPSHQQKRDGEIWDKQYGWVPEEDYKRLQRMRGKK